MGKIVCFDISTVTEKDYNFLYKNVSRERQTKADRYKDFHDKTRCIVAEAILRHILKINFQKKIFLNYKAQKDTKSFLETLVFEKNRYGKPYIKNLDGFHFNISHSGKWVVVAYSENNIGVDIEKIDRCKNYENAKNLAERFFCEEERGFIFENKDLFQQRFIMIWTAKESYLKYKGIGISKLKDSENTLNLTDKGLYSTTFDNEYCLSCFCEDKGKEIITLSYEALKKSLCE